MKTLVQLVNEISLFSDLDSDSFNSSLAQIQKHIGQDDGGFAGIWFADERRSKWELGDDIDRKQLVISYVHDELSSLSQMIGKQRHDVTKDV